MFRCILAELFSLGSGHALTGALGRAAAWAGAVVACTLLALVTPWAMVACVVVRIASIVEAGRRGRRGPVDGRWHWKPALIFFAVSFGFLLVTRTVALEMFRIPSPGMAPTLTTGDLVVGDKLSLLVRAPSRGEVVVYRADGIDFVGRIVAVGGDTVAIRDGTLHLNGRAVPRRALGEGVLEFPDEERRVPVRERVALFEESVAGHTFRVTGHLDEPGSDEPPSTDYPTERVPCDNAAERGMRAMGIPLTDGPDGTCVVPPGSMFVLGDNRKSSNDSRWRGAFPTSSVRARVVGITLGGPDHRWSRIGATE